jgi:hypothetical protein
MDLFRAQSERFGTTIFTETITKIDFSRRPFRYWREGLELEEPETADSIIIATGASARRLNLPGEETYWQSGISACAVCDGAVPIFRKKPLAVVGGGDSACEEATYLTKVRLLYTRVVQDDSRLIIIFQTTVRFQSLCPSPSRSTASKQGYGEATHQPPKGRSLMEHRTCRVQG